MNRATPHTPLPDGAPEDGLAERRLRHALRELPMGADDAVRVEALQQRVLAQWQAAHAPAGGTQANGAGPLRSLVLAGPGRRRWLLGSGLLVLGGAALALGLWLQQPDPALDELLQPDVLSQMAIGQM